ncbi:MAG TPA: hypothetical protein DCZ94_00655 [Lentisphaeria bacterium]|nr:MAG: hypothetical protein A2X48_12220 [Lentisphaerae bacterium GWF2_49_21]HBC85441.1 hypothetical protein [Lentisphaeria bacterium]
MQKKILGAFPLSLIIVILGVTAFGTEPDKAAARVPVPIDSIYKLVFDDEFKGTSQSSQANGAGM